MTFLSSELLIINKSQETVNLDLLFRFPRFCILAKHCVVHAASFLVGIVKGELRCQNRHDDVSHQDRQPLSNYPYKRWGLNYHWHRHKGRQNGQKVMISFSWQTKITHSVSQLWWLTDQQWGMYDMTTGRKMVSISDTVAMHNRGGNTYSDSSVYRLQTNPKDRVSLSVI